MAFGDRIKARREELALSRPQLADRLGVTPSTVSNYETGVMRRHLTGGWQHLVEFWDEAEKFHCDMVILHDDITCKGALGLTGVILDQAKEKQTKLMMVSNDMFDHRTISRADIRQQVNDYMYSVMQAEPLDVSLLQYDDYEGW